MFKPLKVINLSDIVDSYDVLLFDIWGVIVEDDENPHRQVVSTINELSKSKIVRFISNAPRPAEYSQNRLSAHGINTVKENIFTSGEIARKTLKNTKKFLNIEKPVVFHLGPTIKNDVLNNINVATTENIKDANILLLTTFVDHDGDLTQYNSLFKVAIEHDAICLCANPDEIIPYKRYNRYCSGYFGNIYKSMGGRVVYTGKPYPEIFEELLITLKPNIMKDKVLMVGDTLETDVLGANNVGLHSALVLTGNSSRITQTSNVEEQVNLLNDKFASTKIYPNYIINIK